MIPMQIYAIVPEFLSTINSPFMFSFPASRTYEYLLKVIWIAVKKAIVGPI